MHLLDTWEEEYKQLTQFATMNFRGPLWYRECQEVFAVINDVSVLTEVAFKFNDGVHKNDRLTFDYDFVSTFFAGVVLTLVAASST